MLKRWGAIYIILGTCVAAGMLGLPIVTAKYTIYTTSWMVVSAWLLMTIGAWCLLQVNLWFPPNSNLISMSAATLGKPFKWITWIVYLLLLYSLICAYLSAAGDLLHNLLQNTFLHISRSIATVLATIGSGLILLYGIKAVDYINRLLMSVKLVICLVLIALVVPHAQLSSLLQGAHQFSGSVWLVIVCAFGYGIILPTIRVYLHSQRRHLMQVLLIGSFIPLVLYFLWIVGIQGALPRWDNNGLTTMANSAETNSLLMNALVQLTHQKFIQLFSVVFISICSITGLLGVSLCLTDFLADGIKRAKQGTTLWAIIMITLLPSMVIDLINPAMFTLALQYAGFLCLYTLVFLPVAMFIAGKYQGKTIDASVSP